MIWSRIYYVSILFSFSSNFNIKHRPAYHSNWNFNMIFRSLDTFIRLFSLCTYLHTVCDVTNAVPITACPGAPGLTSGQVTRVRLGIKVTCIFSDKRDA